MNRGCPRRPRVTATATANEPRMNADERGSIATGARLGAPGPEMLLLGARASYSARGARRALAPRPPSGSGARGSPAAAPNFFRPRCRELSLPRSDPRVSALIRGSLPLPFLLPYPRHPRSSAAHLLLLLQLLLIRVDPRFPCCCRHPRRLTKTCCPPRIIRGRGRRGRRCLPRVRSIRGARRPSCRCTLAAHTRQCPRAPSCRYAWWR